MLTPATIRGLKPQDERLCGHRGDIEVEVEVQRDQIGTLTS
jgi:hypothetical protein